MGWMRHFKRKRLLLVMAVIGVIAAMFSLRKAEEPDTLHVPLGVEQAAIVTYGGPAVTVAPYKWGVAVNVRIAEVIDQPDKRVYDVRYIVNRAGTFDLKDYLTAEDGSALAGLPTFKFTGDPKLSTNLDTRIQETEEIQVDVGGRYYETLIVLTILWIVWLLLLIYYKREHPQAEAEAAPSGPTLAEMLREFLARLQAGTLDADAKAKLEMTLLKCWRDELAIVSLSMSASMEAMERHDTVGALLRKLQRWLHQPSSSISRTEIADLIAPYTVEAAAARAMPQPSNADAAS
jgi:hypothetical protein